MPLNTIFSDIKLKIGSPIIGPIETYNKINIKTSDVISPFLLFFTFESVTILLSSKNASKPTLLTAFMGPWGDFVFASYVAFNNTDGMNVAVGLNNLVSTPGGLANNYTIFCAGGVIVAIPITILFICLQKYYVEGVTGGAVKG
jgi:ABC-type maltose transport system permease subunit